MSDTEIRTMRYTIEQLSTELQATKQYVSDIKNELEFTRKALDIAKDALTYINTNNVIAENVYFPETDKIVVAQKALEQITELEQKGE